MSKEDMNTANKKLSHLGGVREERGIPECWFDTFRVFKNGKRKFIPQNQRKRKYYQGRVDRILHT